MVTSTISIIIVIIAGILGGFGPIYFKKGSDKLDIKNLATIYKNWFIIIGLGVYAISTVMFIIALKGGELSILYPLVGLAYVWVAIYSIFLLKEKMTIQKWIGIAIVAIGVAFIGFGM